ncbi:hypothetical protein ACHAQJ_006749 [Trichoderma viride]
MAKPYSCCEELPVPEKPKGRTLLPSALLASIPLAAESPDGNHWEVTTLSANEQGNNIRQTFRADHPFLTLGEGPAYIEADASAPESQQNPVSFAIGFCGEFVYFGSSYSRTGFHPSIEFHGDDGRI